jgi:hypothetical protein
MTRLAAPFWFLLLCFATAALPQGRGPAGPPPAAKAISLIDLTGYWVSIVNEDWRWRMVTPPKGDFASVPLNAEGRKIGNTWDPVKDEASGAACKAYGAAGLMRLPTRLHITWADDNTLRIETDAGKQTRLLHFGSSTGRNGASTLQGDSVATWQKQPQQRGFAPAFATLQPGAGGALKVVTTHMGSGYLRKNGVPYSELAGLTEYFERVEHNGVSYLILTSVVEDQRYLTDTFITSEQFKQEADGSKWNPQDCKSK